MFVQSFVSCVFNRYQVYVLNQFVVYVWIKTLSKLLKILSNIKIANGKTVLALCVFKPAERDTVFRREFKVSLPKEGATSPT